jgi:hypothetical protein
VISKEQAKTLSLIFSSTKQQKIVKNSQPCTERTYLFIIKLKKKYSSRDTIPLKLNLEHEQNEENLVLL